MSKILVVDDLADICEPLAMLLGAMGHESRVAFDGGQAVRTTLEFEPDIVFMDLDMPVMSGYEAAHAIRAQAAKQPFLIALTGAEGMAVQVATTAVGFDHYLRKPAVNTTLFALVADLSQRAWQPRP